ncbi:NAD(P)-dependent oxidoreductase [Roseibacterium sp. SDUM158017]|uniref:NAD-dependent epimerase/dehydratase family protein n=1 Tax=Roseicyclus salinarum TaxID=3036773 RepID=UPI002415655D|nr:NAD(P)-dependent oxidoreductase [Roseibacterium sp. SDUM158017]MDG4647879.1 NAD(P)-dependent oxidoreductase [Roseibacterium sp. SDUM158017]
MAKILVTGAGGFLGGAVARALVARGDGVIGLDCGPNAGALDAMAVTEPAFVSIVADICDADAVDAVFAGERPDAVIHCAAVVGVLASLASPVRLFRVNVEGSVNILEAMVRHRCGRMIHISSEEIYGDFLGPRIDETHREAPLHAYGISKCAVEHLGRSYRATRGIEVVNIRTSWVYGPGFLRDRVPLNMIRAAAEGRALHVPGGAEERIDHTYLDDAVAGVIGALDCADHPFDAYHVASDSAPSLAEIAEVVRDLVPDAEITVGDGPYRHGGDIAMPRKGALDCTRAREAFGYRPQFDIRAGLAATLEAHRAALATQD